jgi:hypothetical protein
LCSYGSYGSPPKTPCTLCSTSSGVECRNGSVIPWVKQGYYRAGSTGIDVNTIIKCNPAEACAFTGYNEATTCSAGYNGYKCAECEENYHKAEAFCKSCPSSTVKWLTILGMVIILIFILWRAASQKSARMSPDLRMILSSLQILALYPGVSDQWPDFVLIVLRALSLTVGSSVDEFANSCRRILTLSYFHQIALFPWDFGSNTISKWHSPFSYRFYVSLHLYLDSCSL